MLAGVAGAAWAAIAGFLKATVGVHEVISTIMLNWIAIWITQALVGQGGQLQNSVDKSVPVSSDIVQRAHLPVFWGDPVLQGLHIGFFIALAAPVVYWIILNRTTLGYEVRATGFNPEAARYGGISVKRSYVLAMAISGTFAGLAGAIDILGWQFRLGVLDIQVSQIGFIGIAVALLGRNSAIGVPLGALLFGALLQGTSTRNPAIQDVIKPELAGNLTLIIQGLVLLFVGADLFFLWLWNFRKRIKGKPAAPPAAATAGDLVVSALSPTVQQAIRSESAVRWTCWAGIALSALGLWLVLPAGHAPLAGDVVHPGRDRRGLRRVGRSPRRDQAGMGRRCGRGDLRPLAYGATQSSLAHLDGALTTSSGAGVVDWGQLTYNMFVFATPLAFAAIGGMFSERSGVVNIGLEGMMLSGCFFGILGADKFNSWELGILTAAISGAVLGLIHAFFSVHMRSDQIVGGTAINFLALGITGYFFIQIYGAERHARNGRPVHPGRQPHFLNHIPPKDAGRPSFWYQAFGHLNLMIWVLFAVDRPRVLRRCSGRRSAFACGRSASIRAQPRPSGSTSTRRATARSSSPV